MKIFVVGGTGVLGRRLVRLLIQDEHKVAVLSRSKERSELIKTIGASPIEVDLFDLSELRSKIKNYDGYIHCATAIPSNLRQKASDWEMNKKLRSEGVDNLIEVAKSSDCKFFIKESITFHYGHQGEYWVDENTPISDEIKTKIKIDDALKAKVLDNAVEMEDKLIRLAEMENFPSIILRFGWFYSHDSQNIEMMARRQMPIIGNGSNLINIVHVDDAAKAILQAVRNYEQNRGEIINIVDDLPVPVADFLNYGTELATGKKPRKIPVFLAKLVAGSYITNFMTTSCKIKNQKAKDRLDWSPQYPTYKKGLQASIKRLKMRREHK